MAEHWPTNTRTPENADSPPPSREDRQLNVDAGYSWCAHQRGRQAGGGSARLAVHSMTRPLTLGWLGSAGCRVPGHDQAQHHRGGRNEATRNARHCDSLSPRPKSIAIAVPAAPPIAPAIAAMTSTPSAKSGHARPSLATQTTTCSSTALRPQPPNPLLARSYHRLPLAATLGTVSCRGFDEPIRLTRAFKDGSSTTPSGVPNATPYPDAPRLSGRISRQPLPQRWRPRPTRPGGPRQSSGDGVLSSLTHPQPRYPSSQSLSPPPKTHR